MACIERRPRCGTAESSVVPEPLSDIAAAIGIIVSIVGVVGGILSALEIITVEAGILSIGGVAIGGAAASGVLAGLVAAITVIIIVGLYALDRCVQGKGLRECVAGVVTEVVESFSDTIEQIFPFAAMHDRVDLVVKSRFWDVVEDGEAFVHCTDEEPPRRSEIMRCYYFDRQVCDAATGSQIGAGVGAVAGIIAAALVAAAIGCATIILCLLAIIVAAIVAAVVALVGALVGGQIAKAVSEDDHPEAGGVAIAVGDYITAHGNMQRREHDNGANVLWWVNSTELHGRASDDLPRPFSYCDVNDELPLEGCAVAGPD